MIYGTSPTSWAQTFPTAYNNIFQKVNIIIKRLVIYQYQLDSLVQTDIVAHEIGLTLGLADIKEEDAT